MGGEAHYTNMYFHVKCMGYKETQRRRLYGSHGCHLGLVGSCLEGSGVNLPQKDWYLMMALYFVQGRLIWNSG